MLPATFIEVELVLVFDKLHTWTAGTGDGGSGGHTGR